MRAAWTGTGSESDARIQTDHSARARWRDAMVLGEAPTLRKETNKKNGRRAAPSRRTAPRMKCCASPAMRCVRFARVSGCWTIRVPRNSTQPRRLTSVSSPVYLPTSRRSTLSCAVGFLPTGGALVRNYASIACR